MPFRVTFFAAHAIICIIMVYLEKEEQILEFLHLNATFDAWSSMSCTCTVA